MFQLQLSTLVTITPSDFILATVEAVSSEDAAAQDIRVLGDG